MTAAGARNLAVVLLAALVVALPFALRRESARSAWAQGDPVLVIISPHHEAIRDEFERGFARWHRQRHGTPVRIDWRNIGGTTEILRFLSSEFAASAQAWWRQQGKPWPAGAVDAVVGSRPPRADRPELAAIYEAFRRVDDPRQVGVGIDLLFGGGAFDHMVAYRAGLSVAPWPPGQAPPGLFAAPDGTVLIPEQFSGETCRTPTLFGNAASMFGIVYNVDRLRALGVPAPPIRWADLADPIYAGTVGLADPTKSGSSAKAFEMIVQQSMREAAIGAGFDVAAIARFEAAIETHAARLGRNYRRGDLPPDVPPEYQAALERGWVGGMLLIQRIAANARYFTDSASKVAIDVSMGDAAVGMAIDFYARYQAQVTGGPLGRPRMVYVTPVGGTSVSCDPVGLLRGAPHREVALRFIEYVLGEEGQQLWTYLPGTPGGPERHALRRLPVRRDFYPSAVPAMQAAFERHRRYAADDLGDPSIDPYQVARHFTYYPRWTGRHFGVQREIIRAMALDSGDDLRAAWRAVRAREKVGTGAMLMRDLPAVALTNRRTGAVESVPLTWRTAPDFSEHYDPLEYLRAWTAAFRARYRALARPAPAARAAPTSQEPDRSGSRALARPAPAAGTGAAAGIAPVAGAAPEAAIAHAAAPAQRGS
jgi:ABC-type Fe3+ transport system substrate-binding protein